MHNYENEFLAMIHISKITKFMKRRVESSMSGHENDNWINNIATHIKNGKQQVSLIWRFSLKSRRWFKSRTST